VTDRLAEIEARLTAAPEGPWWWSRSYELFDDDGDGKHWGLHNAASEAKRSVLDFNTVTFTTQPNDIYGKPLDQSPVFQLIANAPSDIAWLIEQVRRLEQELVELSAGESL
jgi:hypothetical protein